MAQNEQLMRINLNTPVGRLSYPHLFTAQTNDQGDERFKTAIFFAEGADLTEMQNAAMTVAKARWGDEVVQLIRANKVRWPFRSDAADVKERGYPEGSTFVNMSAKNRPGVVDANVADVLDVSEAYAGRDALINATAYTYDVSGNRGVTFGVNHVQLLGHNDRLDGRKAAAEVFAPVEGVIADVTEFAEEAAPVVAGSDDDISDLVGK
jgi:hypothetical protein